MKRTDFLSGRKISQPFGSLMARVPSQKINPDGTSGIKSEDKATGAGNIGRGVQVLSEFQTRSYAQDRWSVLLIFQAMDAAGKDSGSSTSCRVSTRRLPRSTRSSPLH